MLDRCTCKSNHRLFLINLYPVQPKQVAIFPCKYGDNCGLNAESVKNGVQV